jgi:hypothetical protein
MAFINNPRHGRAAGGAIPRIIFGAKEANSQSFKAGQLVYLNSGAVTVVADGGTAVMGIAMKDATNVSSGNIEIPIMVIEPGDSIIARIYNSNTSAHVLSSSPVQGVNYGIVSVSNVTYVNYYNTTNDVFVFIEPVYDQLGVATYWGKFKLISAASQVTVGA